MRKSGFFFLSLERRRQYRWPLPYFLYYNHLSGGGEYLLFWKFLFGLGDRAKVTVRLSSVLCEMPVVCIIKHHARTFEHRITNIIYQASGYCILRNLLQWTLRMKVDIFQKCISLLLFDRFKKKKNHKNDQISHIFFRYRMES